MSEFLDLNVVVIALKWVLYHESTTTTTTRSIFRLMGNNERDASCCVCVFLCAIHSFVNRENTICSSSISLYLVVCVCVCVYILGPYTASSHHSLNIHKKKFAQRQTIEMKCWRKKNVKVKKKTHEHIKCLYMMWPAAFHSNHGACYFQFTIYTVVTTT